MIKDFGNGRLPRFKAGSPLLDQVTAERLNDMCAMIESARLQNGVGYMMNRSSGGTTLSILDNISVKNNKLWRIDLGGEFSEMEKSLLAVYTAKDDEVLPDVYFPKADTIRTRLISGFTTLGKFPKSGDAVWNEMDGLRYIIFTEKAFKDGGGADESDFYAIKFELGDDDAVKTFYALYAGEHPQAPVGREPTEPIAGPMGPQGPKGDIRSAGLEVL